MSYFKAADCDDGVDHVITTVYKRLSNSPVLKLGLTLFNLLTGDLEVENDSTSCCPAHSHYMLTRCS